MHRQRGGHSLLFFAPLTKLVETTCVALLLATFVVSAGMQIASTSPVYDEPVHVAAGYTYARWGDYRLNPEHPPLLKMIAALPLLFRGVTPAEPPELVPAGEPSLAELAGEWKAALADPSAEWTFAHSFLYGLRGSALARLGRGSTFQVHGTDPVERGDYLNDAGALVNAARWMVVPFGALLALLVYLWSRELFGAAGGLLSLTLFVFEPSLVAHSALVTTDVPIALCLFGSVYFFWRRTATQSWPAAAAFVLFTAAAFLVKFTAAVLIPLLLVLALLRRTRIAFALLVLAALVTYGGIWAAYGFRYAAATDVAAAAADEQSLGAQRPLPGLPDRAAGHFPLQYSLRRQAADARFFAEHGRTPADGESQAAFQYTSIRGLGGILLRIDRLHLLPEAYTYGVAFARERAVFRSSYLRGEYSDTGFPSFFWWTFLLKTPLVTIALIACGIGVVLLTRTHRVATRFAWIAVLAYLFVAVRSNLNIGHRHLLPILPFLFVLCGALAVRWARFAPAVRRPVAVLVLLLVVLSGLFVLTGSGPVSAVRDRLAYINELGGGPAEGYRSLVDSNLDWGQDLPKLRAWLDAHHVSEPINLCYFGTADPRFYGIRHRNLFLGYEYEPDDGFAAIAPGLLAISATNRAGSAWDAQARDEWRKFLDSTAAQPAGRAGSILIYRLTKR